MMIYSIMSNTPNMLFYSRNCKTCSDLFVVLKKENMLAYLKLICIDDILDKIPSYITRVPTLVLTNINKPLVCGEIFEWINTVQSFNKKNNISSNKLDDVQGYIGNNFQTHVSKDKDENPYFDINSKIEPIKTPSLDKPLDEKNFTDLIVNNKNVRVKESSFFSNVFSNQHKEVLKKYDDELKKIKK